MMILVINAGSSSAKFALFDHSNHDQLAAKGVVERIGSQDTRFIWVDYSGKKFQAMVTANDTRAAVGAILETLKQAKVLDKLNPNGQIQAVGHRVVHGGEDVRNTVRIDTAVKKKIEACFDLAPLHNPANLEGVNACEEYLPGAIQVAVFDTAFHATLPPHAFLYGLPYSLYKEGKIRRYGFHGTSHRYVAQQAAKTLNRPIQQLKIVTCHLGNGCSITAVKGGRSIDTSMGMTPLEGLVMGTRCGDIDPAIIFHLISNKGLNVDFVERLLNNESGLLGLAGLGSGDLRDITTAMQKDNEQAQVALEVFAYRVKKYIGAYAFAMGGLDAVVFTAGVGENSSLIRKLVCDGLGGLGVELDDDKNGAANGEIREIQGPQSQVRILVVPTDEEKAIALETVKVLELQTPPQNVMIPNTDFFYRDT